MRVVKSVKPKRYTPAIGPINVTAQTVAVMEFTLPNWLLMMFTLRPYDRVAIKIYEPYDRLVVISTSLPTTINPTAPRKPMTSPTTRMKSVRVLKITKPKSNANSGVSELRIPANELLMPVSALVNRNAGIKLPNKPIPKNPFQCGQSSFLRCLKMSGERNKKAISIRMAATSSLVYTSNPRFININELPQMRASAMKMDQLMNLVLAEFLTLTMCRFLFFALARGYILLRNYSNVLVHPP